MAIAAGAGRIEVPYGYTSETTPAYPSWTAGTLLRDFRGGQESSQIYDYGYGQAPIFGLYVPKTRDCYYDLLTQQAAHPGSFDTVGCNGGFMEAYSIGQNYGVNGSGLPQQGWTTWWYSKDVMDTIALGIKAMHISDLNCGALGDCHILDNQIYAKGGCLEPSAECIAIDRSNIHAYPIYQGTVNSVTTTATRSTLALTCTGNCNWHGNGQHLINKTTGVITATTVAVGSLNGDGTSTAVLTGPTVTASTCAVLDADVPTPIATNGATTNMTFTVTASSALATGIDTVLWPTHIEKQRITTAGALSGGHQTITMPLLYAYSAGANICQGSAVGMAIEFTDHAQGVSQWVLSVPTTNSLRIGESQAGQINASNPGGNVKLYQQAITIDTLNHTTGNPDGATMIVGVGAQGWAVSDVVWEFNNFAMIVIGSQRSTAPDGNGGSFAQVIGWNDQFSVPNYNVDRGIFFEGLADFTQAASHGGWASLPAFAELGGLWGVGMVYQFAPEGSYRQHGNCIICVGPIASGSSQTSYQVFEGGFSSEQLNYQPSLSRLWWTGTELLGQKVDAQVSMNSPYFDGFFGFKIGGAAPSGHCLIGNGTYYVDSTSCGGGSVTAVTGTSPIVSSGGTTPAISCPTCGVIGNPLSQFASTTSAQLAGVISDETGTGALVFGTNPSITLANGTGLPLTTGVTGNLPNVNLATQTANTVLGALTATTPSGLAMPSCPTSGGNALTWTSGVGFGCNNITGGVASVSNSDGTLTISPTTGAVVASLALGHANTWTGLQTMVGTNFTGIPIATGISGLGTGIATFLATPSSANLAAALTDETGTGAAVFANGGTLIAPILGTPASGVVTNLTGTGAFNITGSWDGVTCSGVPTSGQVPTATAGTTCTWQTPSGSSGISGGTAGFFGVFGSATTITGSGFLDYNITNALAITSTVPFIIAASGNGLAAVEGTAPSGVALSDLLYPDSTAHRWRMINNNGTATSVAGLADFATPPAIGNTTPGTGAFTTLSATTPIVVGSGGTGAGTFTAHGVLFGETTSAFGVSTAGTTGQCLLSNGASTDPSFQTCPGGGSSALNAITAATGANTIANGNNGLQIWNWAATTNQNQFQFGETTAATNGTLGNQYILSAKTLAGSTAVPLGVICSLTGSQTLPCAHITPTWNTTGVVDAALLVNVTNTASGAASKLFDLQIGGVSQFNVDKAGISTQLGASNALAFVSTGTTAGFMDFPQGSTSVGVAPCNAATSICEQAPTAVTSYQVTKPGAAGQGVRTGTLSGTVITESFSGDTGHSANVTIGSGTSIGSTNLCSSALCPAGTYQVNAYADITTACGTTGTYIINLIYTDDQGSKTIPININGTGAVPATGILTTTSTANFGENAQIIRSTGATSINYSTTATACGTAGPMVGKLYLSVIATQ